MKRIIFIVSLLSIVACSDKNTTIVNEDITSSEAEYSDEYAAAKSSDISYEGTYKGIIKGKELVLEINEEDFSLTQNGKKIKGKWAKINDGTTIELEPTNGSIQQKFYGWSDEDAWMALTDSLTIPDKEEFLKRVDN